MSLNDLTTFTAMTLAQVRLDLFPLKKERLSSDVINLRYYNQSVNFGDPF